MPTAAPMPIAAAKWPSTRPVTLLSPEPGGTVAEGQTIPFRVTAVDDVKVASVELSVDGAPVATLTQPPFETLVTLPNIQADTPMLLLRTMLWSGTSRAGRSPRPRPSGG